MVWGEHTAAACLAGLAMLLAACGQSYLPPDGATGGDAGTSDASTDATVDATDASVDATDASVDATDATFDAADSTFDAMTGMAELVIAPASHDFGPVVAGSTSAPLMLVVQNDGLLPTGPLSVAKVGLDPSQFSIVSDGCTALALGPSESCTIELVHSPAATGSHTAEITVSASPGGIVTASVRGDSIYFEARIEPSTADFGAVPVGTSSPPISFRVFNPSTAAGLVRSVTKGGANATDFHIVSDACGGAWIPPGGSCFVEVRFGPSTLGTRSATLRVETTEGVLTAALSGTGQTYTGIVITPTTGVFPAPTATLEFTVTNLGSLTSGVVSIALIGAGAIHFTILGNTCSGSSLPPGGTCTVMIEFAPTISGSVAAQLQASASPGGTDVSDLLGMTP